MNFFSDHPDFYNQAIRLDKDQWNQPLEVLRDFFDSYYLHEVRQTLWNLIQAAVTSDNYFFSKPEERDQLFLFYEKLEKLLEADLLLIHQP